MILSHLLLTLGWLAYGFLHSLLATARAKQISQKLLGSRFRYFRFLYSLLALALLIGLMIWQCQIPTLYLWSPTIYTRAGGLAILLAGLTGMGLCLKKYFSSPTGIAGIFFEGDTPPLQKQGLHRMVRHPLYLSTFVLLTGGLIIFPFLSLALATAAIITYTLLAIPVEEKKLVALYGEEYVQYQRDVPSILPNWRIGGLAD